MTTNARKSRSNTAPIVAASDAGSVPSPNSKSESVTGLTAKVADLERRLAKAVKERNDLARDVEALCMQSGSSIFDGSMLLSERVFESERELSKARTQLAAVTEERDNLREDLRGHKDSKRMVDASWRTERTRAEGLEKELHFYQDQSAKAMADRDQAAWEAEELKRNALDLETRVGRAESQAEAAAAEQREVSRQLAEAERRIRELEFKARECETIPGLWRHIAENTERIRSMEVAHDAVERSLSIAKSDSHDAKEAMQAAQHKHAAAEKELEGLQSRSQSEARSAAATIRELEGKVQRLEDAREALETRAAGAEASAASLSAERDGSAAETRRRLEGLASEHARITTELKASHTAELERKDGRLQVEPLRKELEKTKSELAETSAEFEKTRTEKVQALMRVGQAEATAEQAFEETGRMLGQVNDLKDTAAQATQEKVAALMQVASLKEQLRAAGRTPSTQPTLHSRASGWRLWGAGSPATESSEADGAAASSSGRGQGTPQDLREAIDQLRGLHERVADLETLAGSARGLRTGLEEILLSLLDKPTYLRRKELARRVDGLEAEIRAMEDRQREAAAQAAGGSGVRSEESSPQQPATAAPSPGRSPAKAARRGDAEVAEELLLTLRLLLEVTQRQSKP